MQTFYDPQKVRTDDKHIEEVSPTGDDRPGFGEFANVPGGIHRRPPTEAQKRARTENKHSDEPSTRTMQTNSPSDTLPTSRLVSNNRCSELTEMFSPAQLASAERPRGERGQLLDEEEADLQRALIASMTEIGALAMCPYSEGDTVLYSGRDGSEQMVTVSAVNTNVPLGEEPMVAVQMPDGSVRDTVLNRMAPVVEPLVGRDAMRERIQEFFGKSFDISRILRFAEQSGMHKETVEEIYQKFVEMQMNAVEPVPRRRRTSEQGVADVEGMPPNEVLALLSAETQSSQFEEEYVVGHGESLKEKAVKEGGVEENLHLHEEEEAGLQRALIASITEGCVQPVRPKSGGIADKIAARKKAEAAAAAKEAEKRSRNIASKIAARKKSEREAAEAEARMEAEKRSRNIAARKKAEAAAAAKEAEKRSRNIASKIAARKKSEREAAEAEARMEAEKRSRNISMEN